MIRQAASGKMMRGVGGSASKWALTAIVITTIVMLVLLEVQLHGLNGPWYGVVLYRRLPPFHTYALMLLACVPTLVAMIFWPRLARRRSLLLLLPMISAISAKMMSAIVADPQMRLSYIPHIVMDRFANSYYIDAVTLSNFPGWISDFPQIMPQLSLHSQTKAPGSILFYLAFIKTMGHSEQTALVAGIVIGALATLSIPMCYWFLRTLELEESEAFCGACFMALCPGFVLFFPMSDPVYPVLSCAAGACWILALRKNSIVFAILLGLVGTAILLVSFNVLVFGLFLLGYTIFVAKPSMVKVLRLAGIAAGTCVIVCGILWLAAGYDPIATFASAWKNQHTLLAAHASERPYPATIWNDLIDFALGSGWISAVVVAFAIFACVRAGMREVRTQIVLLCLFQLVFVAVSALLQSETARVWNFMLPLLMVPVGIELSKQSLLGRVAILTCLANILAADCRNLAFVV
jgi:hypothetical protein